MLSADVTQPRITLATGTEPENAFNRYGVHGRVVYRVGRRAAFRGKRHDSKVQDLSFKTMVLIERGARLNPVITIMANAFSYIQFSRKST